MKILIEVTVEGTDADHAWSIADTMLDEGIVQEEIEGRALCNGHDVKVTSAILKRDA